MIKTVVSLCVFTSLVGCGKEGDAGPAGTQGETGAMGAMGTKGDKGDQGDPGPFPTADLPTGVTLRGAYRTGANGPAAAISQTGITFTFPLSAEPTPHYIVDGATPPTECPGTLAAPEAMPGHLCVYEKFASASVSGTQSLGNPVTNAAPGASKFGFFVNIQTNAQGNFAAVGTWAVTAP
jgi:hypothetical protein